MGRKYKNHKQGGSNLEAENKRLEEQINNILREKAIHWYPAEMDKVRIGVLSDTHIGSIYDNIKFLNFAYEVFEKEKTDIILHAGDMVDGQGNYKGQEYEQYAIGFDNQLETVIKEYPRIKTPTYFIEGNHSFRKISGALIGKTIQNSREDLIFVGVEDADIRIGKEKKHIKIKLIHPSGGTAYALSYNPQRFIESLEGGTKPNLLIIGHYHKAEILPGYREVFAVQAGCFRPEAKVLTIDGKKKIKDIKVGDMVLTHRNRYRKVIKTFKRKYNGKWVKIHIKTQKNSETRRAGKFLLCTEEHPVYVKRMGEYKFISAKDITKTDKLVVLSNDCLVCGKKIPAWRKICYDGCNIAHLDDVRSKLKNASKLREENLNKERRELRQKLNSIKKSEVSGQMKKHYYNNILPHAKKLEEQGFRVIPIGIVFPDIIAIRDNKVIAYEIENSKNKSKELKYSDEFRKFYDEIRWIYNEKIKKPFSGVEKYDYETTPDGLVTADILEIEKIEPKKNMYVYNLEVEEDNSYIVNIFAVHNCIQTQTPYMRRKKSAAMVGFWVLDVDVDNWGINNVLARFWKYYDRGRSINVELKRRCLGDEE